MAGARVVRRRTGLAAAADRLAGSGDGGSLTGISAGWLAAGWLAAGARLRAFLAGGVAGSTTVGPGVPPGPAGWPLVADDAVGPGSTLAAVFLAGALLAVAFWAGAFLTAGALLATACSAIASAGASPAAI